MFAIAKETGWGEDYILDMPIAKAWGYRHAILRSYDVKCNYKIDDEERQEMHDLFKELSRD